MRKRWKRKKRRKREKQEKEQRGRGGGRESGRKRRYIKMSKRWKR